MTLHNTLTWFPFRQSDLDGLELLEEREVVLKDAAYLHSLGESASRDVFCGITGFENCPLFIGGWKRISPTMLRVFIIPTKNIFKHPIAFTKAVLRWRHECENLPGITKIITRSRCNERIDSWMKTTGFVYEKTLKQYADGHDYRLWSRTKVSGKWSKEGS